MSDLKGSMMNLIGNQKVELEFSVEVDSDVLL